ncbi:MAG: tetratricopeptide repeat protein [Chthoniobacterales bacterium]
MHVLYDAGNIAAAVNDNRRLRGARVPRVALVIAAIVLGAFASFMMRQRAAPSRPPAGVSASGYDTAATPVSSNDAATEAAIRFYTARVQRDAEDTRSQNALAELYLQRVRETGNEDYLPLALNAARASLAAVEAERNIGGLTGLAHAEFANHDFAAARDHAMQLTPLQPDRGEPYAILADARIELGDYGGANEALQRLQELDANNAGTETRLARFAVLHGDADAAQQHLHKALALLQSLQQPPAETIAWCHWQLGEVTFSMGDAKNAESHYRDALAIVPDYFRALLSLGRLSAARGDLQVAIEYYERAVRIIPAVDSMAALGDLYHLAGRERDAAARYELVEQLGEHSRVVHGSPYNRNIALFYADHGVKPEEAYALARGEYDAGRHDIYGADALAWTALKSGRIAEAQAAIKEALKLGTLDARLLYHAGMIAHAAGDQAAAIKYLQRALALNPGFDPLQTKVVRETLRSLNVQ